MQCGLIASQNHPREDIKRKLLVAPELFLVGVLDQQIVGSVMVGYEGHRGWINYLAVIPPLQHQGYGRQLMEHAENLLYNLGCPKINLMVRRANTAVMEFYETLGFSCDDVVCMGKRLTRDKPFS